MRNDVRANLDPGVPIVGQATFRVLVAYSTAVVECQCSAKTVIVLPGKGRTGTCPSCARTFGVAESSTMQIGEVVGG